MVAAVAVADESRATSRAARLVKTLFWPAAGEAPPSSSATRSGVKQLREVDGIVSMCVSVLSREGNKKASRTRPIHTGESREQENEHGRRRGA